MTPLTVWLLIFVVLIGLGFILGIAGVDGHD